MKKFYAGILLGFVMLVGPLVGRGQVSITSTGTAVTQNFDGIGTSGTAALPTGFKIGTEWITGTTATTLTYGTSGSGIVASNSTGGAINWANGVTLSSTDRSVGFLSTGTYTSPRSIIYAFTNNTGSTVGSLTINFDYEKYRSGSRAVDWTFYHGTTSTATTPSIAGDHSYPADVDNNVISNPPLSVSKSFTLGGLSIADGTTYYLRWTYTGLAGSTNAQGLGIDNFSITCNTAGFTMAVTQATGGNISPGTINVAPGGSQSFTATADPCYNFSNWVVDGSSAGNANPYTFSNVSGVHTITAVFSSIALTTPIVSSATDVTDNSFTANWNSVTGATGYYVDVFTNAPLAGDLIISEYVEGSSNNKYIEIFNGTGASINLSDYKIELYSNGSVSASATLNLNGTLLNNGVAVYENTGASAYSGSATSNGTVMVFNGNDAVLLRKISTNNVIDIFGRTGEDPGSAWVSGSFKTEDRTLVRKSSIASGISSNPSSGFPTLGTEWDLFNIDDVSRLGAHVFSGGLIYVPGFHNIFVTTTSLDVTGLTAGTNYYYVVRAFNGTCTSPNSSEMAVPSAAACSATTTVTSFSPASGPVSTLVSIKGTGFSTTPASNGVKFGDIFSTNYTKQGDTIIIAEIPADVSQTSIIKVVNGSTCWNSSTETFSLIATTGACTMTDIIISEVFDPASGNNHYIEIFNGTSSTVNLNTPNNYSMQVWNNPSTTNTFDISGSIAPGEVKVYYAGSNGGAASSPAQGAGVGFNEDDEVRLLKNGSVIDRMVAPGNTGFNWRRSNSVAGPNAVYTSSEWSLRQEVDGSLSPTDIGTFTATTNLDFTTHPADQTCTFSMNAVGTGSITAYQWKYYNPTTNAWENVTSGAFPLATIPTSGVGSPTSTSLSITGNFAGYLDYQFYLEIRNGTACSRASNAAQYKYDTRPLYRSKVSGDWTSTSVWEMFDTNTGSWIPVCTYPTSVNSDDVTIKASHTVILDIDNKIDKLSIEPDAILLSSASAKLQILNGTSSGADFIINGTYIDSANGSSSLDFATGAAWQMGANGTLVRCNASSSAVYRDNYQDGMSNIPATANWKIRYHGDNVSFTTATGSSSTASFPSATYYPNLTFESYAGVWNPSSTTTSSRFSGSASTATILGSLDVGGAGTGTVTIYNENRYTSPIIVNGNLTVRSGSTLTNIGNVDGTGFDVDGNVIVDGTLVLNSADTGVLKLTGTSVQTMSGSGKVQLFDLELNNTNAASPNILHALSDTVYNSLSILGTTRLQMTSGNLTLKSSLSRTARVAAIPASANITYNSGKFIAERYINTGIGHERSWQFLATPVLGQSIYDAWQEGGSSSPGYGTRVTGPTGPDASTGIDDNTVNPSMKTYNGTTNLWEGIYNTKTTSLYNEKGYMLFIRGDRTSIVTTTYQPPAVPTILRITGTIHQPSAQPAGFTLGANEWKSVGNPYASPISLEYIFANTSSNISQSVSVWDPSMYGYYAVGGYQTISATLNYMPSPASTTLYPTSTAFKDIQSGQAFFIQAGSTGGAISFNENVKSSTDRLVNFAPGSGGPMSTSNGFAPASNSRNNKQIFRTSLFTSTGVIADGNGVAFDRGYENSIDKHDANKLYNSGENFGMSRQGRWLAVEARAPIQRTDTIFYSMYNLKRQDYQLRFAPENMQGGNLTAWLVDHHLNNRTEVSLADSSFVNISINANPGSSRHDRFYLVFVPRNINEPKRPTPLPKSRKAEGQAFIGESLKETHEVLNASIYPNPVIDKNIQLRLVGFSSGKYTYNLANAFGQVVTTGQIIVNGTKTINTIVLPKAVATGVYQLNIFNGKIYVKSLRTVIK